MESPDAILEDRSCPLLTGIALRHRLLASDSDRVKLIAGNFLVPPAYVPSADRPATVAATSLEPWRPGQ